MVYNVKGAKIFFLSDGFTHAELVEMARKSYNMDMNIELVELTN